MGAWYRTYRPGSGYESAGVGGGTNETAGDEGVRDTVDVYVADVTRGAPPVIR